MRGNSLARLRSLSIAGVAAAVLVLGWWLLATRLPGHIAQVFLPTPLQVVASLRSMLIDGQLLADIRASSLRIAGGLALGAAAALVTGISIATNKNVEAATEPLTSALRYTPLTAFIPILMLRLGIGEGHKVSVLALGIFVQLLPIVVDA